MSYTALLTETCSVTHNGVTTAGVACRKIQGGGGGDLRFLLQGVGGVSTTIMFLPAAGVVANDKITALTVNGVAETNIYVVESVAIANDRHGVPHNLTAYVRIAG